MNKRGQFYIVASVLIVMFLFGMTGISTYAIVKPEPKTLADLSEDLDRESYKIIEYGIYNKQDLNSLIEDFTGEDIAKYFLKKTDDANIVFVYGNRNEMYSLHYETLKTGSIKVGGSSWESKNSYSKKRKLDPDSKKDFVKEKKNDFVKIEVLGNDYFFDLKKNEMFYFVIAQKKDEEVFIERNEKPVKEDRPGGVKRKPQPKKKDKDEDED